VSKIKRDRPISRKNAKLSSTSTPKMPSVVRIVTTPQVARTSSMTRSTRAERALACALNGAVRASMSDMKTASFSS
jgi:hypothetical protein